MIADFHNDVLTSANREKLLKDYSESENKIVCAFFKGARTIETAYTVSKNFIEKRSSNLYLAFEDISYTDNLAKLKKLIDLNPVYVTLTWNNQNIFAGGASSEGGLTPLGRKLIKLLNEKGVTIDLAHLNERSYFEVLSLADKAVCSHTCFSKVNAHARNISAEQISALIQKDGSALIGLTFYRPFLTKEKEANIDDIIRHVDYFCENFPSKNLCIGTDFNGCEDLPSGFSDYSFEVSLKAALLKRGYGGTTVNGILCENLSRYLSAKDKN